MDKLLGMPFRTATVEELLRSGLLDANAMYRRREIVEAFRQRFIDLGVRGARGAISEREAAVSRVRETLRSKGFRLRPNGRFALLDVGEVKTAVRKAFWTIAARQPSSARG